MDYLNFVDGAWRDSAGPRLDVDNPSTGEVIGTLPDSTAADVDVAVTAARRAFSEGSWSRLSPADRAEVLRALAQALEARFDSLADGLVADTGCTARLAPMLQAGAPLAHLRDFADMAPLLAAPVSFPIQTTPGLGQWELPPRAGRCRRRLHRLQLPALPRGLEGGAGDAGGQHRRSQAVASHAVRPERPRRGVPRGRAAARGAQHRARRPGGRRGAGRAPRRGPGDLHRQHCRRQGRHGGGRRHRQGGHARARRQVPGHRASRRGRRTRGPRHPVQLDDAVRAGLRRDHAHAGAGRALRRSSARSSRRGPANSSSARPTTTSPTSAR